MTIEDLANDYMELLTHKENEVSNTIMLYSCCVCGKYKDKEGQYMKIIDEVGMVYLKDPAYSVSHGYCPPCSVKEKEEV